MEEVDSYLFCLFVEKLVYLLTYLDYSGKLDLRPCLKLVQTLAVQLAAVQNGNFQMVLP